MADSRVASRAPLRILCQHESGSCAACCGAYNFADRSPEALRLRLEERTRRVKAVWPDVAALARVRDEILLEEKPQLLFAAVKVCPFAGLVEEGSGGGEGRVGCLLHPTRHPDGKDLRDLAVYPKEVCAGHFCASHDWLRPREADLAQTARGLLYGRVVTDAGLVKAVARAVDDAVGAVVPADRLVRARVPLLRLWQRLLDEWPWRDSDARRFGGFLFDGDDASERTVPSCLFGLTVEVTIAERQILDAIGTRALDADEAGVALAEIRSLVAVVAVATQAS